MLLELFFPFLLAHLSSGADWTPNIFIIQVVNRVKLSATYYDIVHVKEPKHRLTSFDFVHTSIEISHNVDGTAEWKIRLTSPVLDWYMDVQARAQKLNNEEFWIEYQYGALVQQILNCKNLSENFTGQIYVRNEMSNFLNASKDNVRNTYEGYWMINKNDFLSNSMSLNQEDDFELISVKCHENLFLHYMMVAALVANAVLLIVFVVFVSR